MVIEPFWLSTDDYYFEGIIFPHCFATTYSAALAKTVVPRSPWWWYRSSSHHPCSRSLFPYYPKVPLLVPIQECYCGLSESELVNHEKLSDAQCQVPCPGNSQQVCGGERGERDELSVFDGKCPGPIPYFKGNLCLYQIFTCSPSPI